MKRYIKRPDVYKPTLKHYLLIFPLYVVMRLLMMTVRLKYKPYVRQACSSAPRFLGIAWHRHIFSLALGNMVLRPNLEIAGLVSASKDAAFLVAFFKFVGIRSVRGSHERRGREAILDLADLIKSGTSDAFITPDGPRGPSCVAKKGFLVVAEKADSRILAIRFKAHNYITIPSWDKLIIPLPFSRVDMDLMDFANVAELKSQAEKAGKTPEDFVTEYMNS